MVLSNKHEAITDFHSHVSPDKVAFFKKYGLDFVMGRREGCYLWDLDGKKGLFDCHCNGGVFNLGHRNKDIAEALTSALNHLDIGSHHLLSSYRASLAKGLVHLMPGNIKYTVFSVGGGEAVDVAVKLVRGYTGRMKIISATGGYHGHTGFALAAGDEHYRKKFASKSTEFVQVPFGDIAALEKQIDEKTAAVIFETVPATLGIVVPSAEFLWNVRRLCDEKGAQFILDEVQTGLGRTGKMWGFEHFLDESGKSPVPDVVVIGKGLSGGIYPIAATCFRPHLQSVFKDDPFIHISTFGGAELGCAVALKVLEITSDPEFLRHVGELANWFAERMAALMEEHDGFVVGFRQLGLMMGIQMKSELCGPLLTKTAFDRGLLLIYANHDKSVCQFLPPLVMTLHEAEEVMEKLQKAVNRAKKILPVLKMKEDLTTLWKTVKAKVSLD